MKGKVLRLKIILSIFVLALASICLGVGALPKVNKKVFAASTKVSLQTSVGDAKSKEEYSALFQGNVIFSVEKVLLGNYVKTSNNVKTFLGSNNNEIYFKNLQNGAENKTVIDNGQFAVMNNVINGNGEIVKSLGSDEREAIIVSFGAYVYTPDDEETNRNEENVQIAQNDNSETDNENETIHASITYLDVILEKDGKTVPKEEISSNRNINITGDGSGLFFDFVQVIEQKKDASNEGYYKFKFLYMIGNVEYQEEFEFYIINLLSYQQSINPEGYDFGYQAEPTLGWTGATSFEQIPTKGYVKYLIGENGISKDPNMSNQISYPTITYDYTKYKLSYTHTANKRNTIYDYNFEIIERLESKKVKLNVNVSSNAKTYSDSKILEDYDASSVTNLITIVLTEPGTYIFDYDLIYNGYNAEYAPNVGIYPENIKLSVHGLNANYSKNDYEGAKLQYFEIVKTMNNNVDVYIPNGYEYGSNNEHLKDEKLGFVYKYINVEETIREGNVLTSNSKNALINNQLKNDVINKGDKENSYEYVTNLLKNLHTTESELTNEDYQKLILNDIENSNVSYLNNILNNTHWIDTNQGSIWLEGNDEYSKNSFYFYSPTRFTAKNLFVKNLDSNNNLLGYKLNAKQLKNTTSFNEKGYYLVFVEVKHGDENTFWQVFAFQYTSSSVDIKVESIDTNGTTSLDDDIYEVVAGGKYTNKDVRVSWKKPGIFDRDVKGFYFNLTNTNADRDALLAARKQEIIPQEIIIDGEIYLSTRLGGVKKGDFVKYLIRLESEGESATHKIFTIDRQGISGVQPYLVEQMYSGSSIFYSFKTDKYNYPIKINNSITDGFSAITWDEKASGAETFATYSYTPFNQNNNTSRFVNGNMILTNYELGKTINGSKLTRAPLSAFNLSNDSILFNQGIYIIKIFDSAGNTCYYTFIIDKTENYFEINGQFTTNDSLIFGDNVSYNVGNYKAFSLDIENPNINDELKSFIVNASEDSLDKFNDGLYYSNNTTVKNLFKKIGNDVYFTVKNMNVVGYDSQDKIDNSIYGIQGQLIYDINNNESYYERYLYVLSENQTYLNYIGSKHDAFDSIMRENACVSVEINKDNANGKVYYYSGSGEMEYGEVVGTKLMTGSGEFDADGNEIKSGIEGAHATSSKYVAFVWNIGTGNFEVESVTCDFYTLNPNNYKDNQLFFYSSQPEHFELYNQGVWKNNNAKPMTDNSGRGMVWFNNGSGASREGLYVVTRTYRDDLVVDLGDDVRVKNYYFIVDRNGIIDQNIGSNIKIVLLEEEDFNDFSAGGTEVPTFSEATDGIENQRYNVYLSTTKLPATLSIPTGKYVTSKGSSSGYYSGQLNVSVYFKDHGQLLGQYKNKTVKIFSSKDAQIKNGVFVIDIYQYLTEINRELRDRITIKENGTWLFLPGDYIIRITDNVKNDFGQSYEKFIGLRIATDLDQGPQIDSFTGFENENLNKIKADKNEKFVYSATVSQEYLKVVLPAYQENIVERAQVDPNYVVINKFEGKDEKQTSYVNHPYEPKNGIKLDDANSSIVTQNDDGSINIWLDTKLRNDAGEIDLENLNTPLYYTITVRYKIGQDLDYTKYENCYYFYDVNDANKKVKFYEAVYRIIIDREAPEANIKALNENDAFVEEYNQMFDTNTMYENGVHQTTSNLYFTKQYAKYYQAKQLNKGYIYVYQVDQNTAFNAEDVRELFVKRISANSLNDLSSYNLTLPLIDENRYDAKYTRVTYSNFGSIPNLIPNNYYEIVERDAAGNTTQYVIHFCPSQAVVSIPVSVIKTQGNETANVDLCATDLINNTFNIYDITARNNSYIENEKFVKIQIQRMGGSDILKILTTSTTDFSKLNQQIVDAINAEHFGNFNLVITTRQVINPNAENTFVKTININLYDKDKVKKLDAKDLVKTIDGTYFINLAGANNSEGDLIFFAQKVTIQSSESFDTYTGHLSVETGEIIYKYEGVVVDPMLPCLADKTYFIVLDDGIHEPSRYRFRTSAELYRFYNVTFENPLNENEFGEYYSQGYNGIYGYTTALIEYDKTFTAEMSIKEDGTFTTKPNTGDNNSTVFAFGENDKYKTIKLYPDYKNAGSILEAKIQIFDENETFELEYSIVIDTRLTPVALRDYNSGEQRNYLLEPFENVEYNDEKVRSVQSGSGIMNLQWNKIEENEYFDYVYTLYELKKDDNYVSYNLSNVTNYVIATKEDSKGIYKFEISILNKDGTFLGNKIFAFEVQAISTQIYYVRNESGNTVKENSYFKWNDLTTDLQNQITSNGDTINQNISIPLFITNEKLTIVITAMNVESKVIADNNDCKIYKISKKDKVTNETLFNIYLGILTIRPNETIFNSDMVIYHTSGGHSSSETIQDRTSYTLASNDAKSKIELTTTKNYSNKLLMKNLVLVDVYYNNKFVKTDILNKEGTNQISYEILGNGQYSLEFKDLAGNVHKFKNGSTRLNIYALREVVVTINDDAPVANGFYSEPVELVVYASTMYETGSILIDVKKNGEEYKPSGFNPYVFSDYGTYRVEITANYNDGVNLQPIVLKKIVTFTIINVKEARMSIDLTSLNGTTITNVLNTYGEDKTEVFLEMINGNNGGMNISYENVIQYAEQFNITAGKTTFTVSYLVKDGIYPDRTITFGFTLNNEEPKIECSLEKGESTKKNFNIYFNAAILYEQIGEAYIYINDREVAHINENSANTEVTVNTSFKEHGDGDYYIKLVSTSGIVWDSYKVTIKEPLNFWAIIVIIVVVAVVATVTITIIVLRRRMRIR